MCKLYFDAICENQILMLAKTLNGKISTLFIFIDDNSPHNAFVCELGFMRIMTRYDPFYDKHIILNNV